jgi:TonB family protein
MKTTSIVVILLVLMLLVGPCSIWCQTNNLPDQLNSAYKDKILLLRNFYSGNNLAYDENGALQGTGNPGPWTLAGVEIKGIGITEHGIEIVANRMGTLYKDGKPGVVKIGTLKIQVSKRVTNDDTKAAIDLVVAKIFIDPTEDLRPLLPEFWTYYFSGEDLQSRSAAWQATLEKSPLKPKDFSAGKLTPPHVDYAPDPGYSKEAESRHIEGTSLLSTMLDVSGTPVNVAIMQPLGMGLDEQAVSTLKRWRFKPATLDGKAVPAHINIEITFRCCP